MFEPISPQVFPLEPSYAPTRKERADAVENRARLLDTARQLFSTYGVGNVCMSDIVEAAGVGKGTLYRRFANKGELCWALLDAELQKFQDEMMARLREQSSANVSFLAQLSDFMAELVAFVVQNIPLLQEAQSIAVGELAERFNRPHFWQYLTVRGLLQNALRAGEIAPDIDTQMQASLLLAPLQANYLRFQLSIGFTENQIILGIQRIVFGLRA